MDDQFNILENRRTTCGFFSSARPRLHRHGFTLLEMMVVMVILGIAALIIVPNVKSSEPHKLDFLAAELAAAFVHARNEAQRTTNVHGVDFAPGSTSIVLFRATATPPDVLFEDIYRPVTKTPYNFKLKDETVLGDIDVDITDSVTWNGLCNDTPIAFDPSGRPRCIDPWSVHLSSATYTIDVSGHTRTVLIEGETGRVSVK